MTTLKSGSNQYVTCKILIVRRFFCCLGEFDCQVQIQTKLSIQKS